jgi:hypothetical protein
MELVEIKALIEQAVKHYNNGTHLSYATIGELLWTLNINKAYKKAGYNNFNSVIKDVKIPRSTAYEMMDYYNYLYKATEQFPCLVNIPVKAICKAIPAIKSRDVQGASNIISSLVEVSALPDTSDMEDEIKRLYGKQTEIDCPHDETECYERCRTCGKFFRVRDM